MLLLYPFETQVLQLHIRKTAKKNIILRPRDTGSLNINIPAWLSQRALLAWLDAHHALLRQVLEQTPALQPNLTVLPESLWLRGEIYTLQNTAAEHIQLSENIIYVPQASVAQQRQLLRDYYFQAAYLELLPKLAQHSQRLQLFPVQTALTNATTFWGVCRHRTGIRLNWRLIGAPTWVQDYVCVHELCHLIHADHSPAFWAAVNAASEHTAAAKQWLKQYGKELFYLG